VALVLCVSAAIAWQLWLHGPGHKITDREVLQEAVTEWKRAGEPDPGPNYQIFEQQAGQGYYDDAAATARLYKLAEDRNWSVVELAKIRAENGDIQGAKKMIRQVAGPDPNLDLDLRLKDQATRVIAHIQASNGDVTGALETIAPLGETSSVLLAFANRQIASADFDGALKTAEQMNHQDADDVFYGIGDALRLRKEQGRVNQLALHMSNREQAALFLELVPLTLRERTPQVLVVQRQPSPCDTAFVDANRGKFAEADAAIEQNKCEFVAYVAIQQYAVDAVGAEHLLRKNADHLDLVRGLAEFAIAAAKKGNIAEALRLLNDAQLLSGPGSAVNAVQEIARDWTIRDGPKPVLKWTHSRSNTGERTWALIGIAEALGHARRQLNGTGTS